MKSFMQWNLLIETNIVYLLQVIGNPAFCLFLYSYIWLVYIFDASYSTVVTLVSKKSIADQSELEK